MATCSSHRPPEAVTVGGLAIPGEHQDENELGVSAGSIFGLKKTVFNSADFATITASTYAAQH